MIVQRRDECELEYAIPSNDIDNDESSDASRQLVKQTNEVAASIVCFVLNFKGVDICSHIIEIGIG